jgi:hypothetical protein
MKQPKTFFHAFLLLTLLMVAGGLSIVPMRSTSRFSATA